MVWPAAAAEEQFGRGRPRARLQWMQASSRAYLRTWWHRRVELCTTLNVKFSV